MQKTEVGEEGMILGVCDATGDVQKIGISLHCLVYVAGVDVLAGESVEAEPEILCPVLATELAGGDVFQAESQLSLYDVGYGGIFHSSEPGIGDGASLMIG